MANEMTIHSVLRKQYQKAEVQRRGSAHTIDYDSFTKKDTFPSESKRGARLRRAASTSGRRLSLLGPDGPMRERNLTRESKTINSRRPLPPSGQPRWELLAPGAALCGYGWFFSDDLGWLAYGLICLGVFVATVGAKAYQWSQEHLEHWIERLETQPPTIATELALTKAWRHFWLSLTAMFALGAFSLWRVRMTVGRPVAERFYFLSADTWLGRLEHSWFNDALYAFGMVGIRSGWAFLQELCGSQTVSAFYTRHSSGPTRRSWNRQPTASAGHTSRNSRRSSWVQCGYSMYAAALAEHQWPSG